MHPVTSCTIHKVHVYLAVTCHPHFWQNDRGLLHATAVTWGWNEYQNKTQRRKLTLEKKILPPLRDDLLFVVTFITINTGTAVLITCMLIFGHFGTADHLQHCQQSALGRLLCCSGVSLSTLQQVHHSIISILHCSAVPLCAFCC